MIRHSPGPWREDDYGIRDANGELVICDSPDGGGFCSERGGPDGGRAADRRLVADAPALLAGLDEALTLMYDAHPFDCDDSPDYQRLRALVRRHEEP